MRLFSGQRAFVVQRLSALALLACVVVVLLRLAFGSPVTFAQWQAWLAQPAAAFAVAVLAAALLAHAWVGVRDVALDYVRPLGLRLALLGAVALGLIGLGAWVVLILAGHAFS